MLAVLSIQKQASQVEAAFASTELDSLRADHDRLKQVLENKELELKTLRKQFKQGKEKVSSLQLEKDLAQAEAAKCKEHLQSCIQFIVASSAGKNDDSREMKSGSCGPTRRGLHSGLSQQSHRATMKSGVQRKTTVINESIPLGKDLACNSATEVVNLRKCKAMPVVRATLSRRGQVHPAKDPNSVDASKYGKHPRRGDNSVAQLRPSPSTLKDRRL